MADVVEVVRQDIISQEIERFEIIEVGTQGLPGPRGLQGASGGSGFEAPAGQALGGHRAVVFDGGELVYASSTNLAHLHRVAGITTAAAEEGVLTNVVRAGEVIEPTWNWNIALPVYLADNGLLTQTPPAAPAAAFSIVVGFPTSATSLFVTVREPIILT